MRSDQLREVLIGRHHQHLVEAGLLGGVAEGADDVVGLVALAGEHGNTERLNHAAHPGQAELYLLGHSIAVGLILGIHLVAEGGLL